MFKAKLTAL